ncbi:MAG TPA: S53 family peptidase, partial [Solirubrobacterales bacterium]|nr:S53 family peptidase [Solirubrobacterales bacterium]
MKINLTWLRLWRRGAVLAVACAVLLAVAGSANAAGALQGSALGHRYAAGPSKTKPYIPCFRNQERLRANCNIFIEPQPTKSAKGRWIAADGSPQEGTGVLGGWAPKDLQSAYLIPATGGETQTIAVIDAFGNNYAESDMAKYREQYGLPPCTKANGCFRKVNGSGLENNNPPEKSPGWALETSLDLDMASAACPKCHILLVQTFGELPAEMAEAVNTAAKLGATEISNSYGYPEKYKPWCPGENGCSEYASAYHHPGISITAASGDYGYNNFLLPSFDPEVKAAQGAPDWPAASPDVIAVGGTELETASNARGWEEQSWVEGGSGCSLHQPKPTWQLDAKCPRRMVSDVAMVAENLSVYSTPYVGGWALVGGTSASAPLLAGVLAHATQAVRNQGPKAFYTHRLVDITKGGGSTK